MRPRGFTFLELLVAAGIALIILAVVVSAVSQSTLGARLHQDSQLLAEDVRAAVGLMADYVNVSLAVYPPGVTLALGSDAAYTVRNPRTGNGVWEVGRDPILAVLLPPRDASTSCSSTQTEGCLRFAAFYLLSRLDVVRSATGAANPGADPLNDPEARLLYMYHRVLDSWPPAVGGGGSGVLNALAPDLDFPVMLSGARGFLLADYIRGNGSSPGLEVDYRRCYNYGDPGPCRVQGTKLGLSAVEVGISLRAFRVHTRTGRGVEARVTQAAAPRNLRLIR